MNLKELKELIALMDEHQLFELEVEREGMKVRLRKSGSGSEGAVVVERMVQARGSSAPAASDPAPAPAKPKGTEIKSPMVGTFYLAPAPDAAPFVEVGQEIKPGQVLCIIEAMKLMNEIKSEIKGRIVQIPVENAQPIEFGHVLFIVEPT